MSTRGLSQPRAIGAVVTMAVIDQGKSLDASLSHALDESGLDSRDRSWVRELSYGMLRKLRQLEGALGPLLNKPLRKKDRDIHFLLLVGIYQLAFMRTPQHAALAETVEACSALGKTWAKRLVNGCLRNFLRNGILPDNSSDNYSHPDWLAEQIGSAWPDHRDTILAANNEAPPMCLRVNRLRGSREDYLVKLKNSGIEARLDPLADSGVILHRGVSTDLLPGFSEGYCSVQDTAAQFAAAMLDPKPGDRVLDACAAPGGKSGHILEYTGGEAELVAVDKSPGRLALVEDNLARLGLEARTIASDTIDTGNWWDGQRFDSVLLDVPCSGTGVIRRHPDIRYLRKPDDIAELTGIQGGLLDASWQVLRPGGRLLYASCSILPTENQLQIRSFLERYPGAKALPASPPESISCEPGWQTLPGVHECDGFYYCLLEKSR